MNKSKSISIGERFGKLTIIEELEKRRYNNKIWLCKCDCGGLHEATTTSLKAGYTKSCGCLKYYHQKPSFAEEEKHIWWELFLEGLSIRLISKKTEGTASQIENYIRKQIKLLK